MKRRKMIYCKIIFIGNKCGLLKCTAEILNTYNTVVQSDIYLFIQSEAGDTLFVTAQLVRMSRC